MANSRDLEQMSKSELIEYIEELESQLRPGGRTSGSYNLVLSLQSAEILKNRFDLIQKKNPAFSLRAFAKKIEISPGKVSEILNGQYLISNEMAQKVVENIEFENDEKEKFLHAVEIENSNLEELREFHKKMSQKNNLYNKKDLHLLNYDEDVNLLDHWNFYGMMTALEMKACDNTASWIADMMGMEEVEVQDRLEKMIKLNIVELKDGKYFLVPRSNFNSGRSSSPRASQIAAKKCTISAYEYLTERFVREINSGNLADDKQNHVHFFLKAIDTKMIGNAPEFIAQSTYKALEEMSESDSLDSIYMVNIAFVKL